MNIEASRTVQSGAQKIVTTLAISGRNASDRRMSYQEIDAYTKLICAALEFSGPEANNQTVEDTQSGVSDRDVRHAFQESKETNRRLNNALLEAQAKIAAMEEALKIPADENGHRSRVLKRMGTDGCIVEVPLQNWKAVITELDALRALGLSHLWRIPDGA